MTAPSGPPARASAVQAVVPPAVMDADGTLADGWKRWATDHGVSLLAVLREAERRRLRSLSVTRSATRPADAGQGDGPGRRRPSRLPSVRPSADRPDQGSDLGKRTSPRVTPRLWGGGRGSTDRRRTVDPKTSGSRPSPQPTPKIH